MEITEILKSKEAKLNFLKGLIRIAKCDGIVDEREFAFYKQTATVMGLDEESVDFLDYCREGTEKIEVSFEDGREKMFFLIQLVQLCWVNDEYSEVEKAEVRKLAKELEISLEALDQVEKWAYEGIIWNKRGEKLLDLR